MKRHGDKGTRGAEIRHLPLAVADSSSPSGGREAGQMVVAAVLLVATVILVAGAIVDVYRLQETRSWAYRAAEAAALAGAASGRDLGAVYTTGQPRIDPAAGHDAAEQALQEALARRGVAGATYRVEVLEWGGTVAGFPPVPRADMWGLPDWTSPEPAVGVYLTLPVETFLLGLVTGDEPVTVHAFAAAGVSTQ
jgi:hypothetical protein